MRTSVLHTLMALAVVAAACTVGDTETTVTHYEAALRTLSEVGGDTITASGAAAVDVSISGTTINYTITFTTVPTDPITVGHIHSGAAGTNGTVRVNLCGTGAPAPACPTSTTAVTGSATAVTGITLDSLQVLLRTYGAYANMHNASHGGGLMRGQLFPKP